jgi:hypothetical protein
LLSLGLSVSSCAEGLRQLTASATLAKVERDRRIVVECMTLILVFVVWGVGYGGLQEVSFKYKILVLVVV